MITQEILRTFLVSIGWLVLVFASLFILIKSWLFYRETKGSPFGKLVAAANAGWLITMYSLGLVCTFYLFRDIASLRIIFPIFVVWFVTLVILLYVTVRWSNEASALHATYTNMSREIERHTSNLNAACKRELENEKEVEHLKDEILFVAAHELRSPVSAIKWGLTTLLEDKEFNANLTGDLKEIFKNIYIHNERLGDLVGRLLNTARIEQGVLSIKTENVFLVHSIHEVLDEIKHLAGEQNVHIINTIENPPPVLADPTLVKEILTNLITNAIRYNVPNGSVTITEKHTDAAVLVNITDTGQGIPAEKLTDIFQKFHSISEKRALGKEKSVGLGLYITKELVTRMGGTIRATSELGKGSTFTFTLPRDTPPK
ncbi:MAG: hypothetical protein A3J55_01515 [Candidatus Ryanbacteria bacterium RIFCSPHIGHO2_02_FULL_45_17b]|uniref:histidine kinase n=1 Tax=Candidatus Ryanbacteria bacterium RIFCSPHIGHO2_01_FULL_45_22 TaxID=1802114 RepID=A0A1G2FZR3_9BACT|nr:MAG: hypothetical protein A2719_00330 [Candidatus Ryanbacteria bacterium RIFCSPHIGHO2_01_FULL_45_22]OGZ47446.1 MAG: hypothetical protein A3J55_01515 [Candidatus Ryanbacteria bacterium RIFCSPHIGHO2_02_FULL_45_17b]